MTATYLYPFIRSNTTTKQSNSITHWCHSLLQKSLMTMLAIGVMLSTQEGLQNGAIAGPATDMFRDAATQQKRQTFLSAKTALENSDWATYNQHRQTLNQLNYELAPYLDYLVLKKQLRDSNDAGQTQHLQTQLQNFANTAASLGVLERLEKAWLNHLARTNQWSLLISQYPKVSKPSDYLKCQRTRAELATQGRIANPQKAVQSLWLVPGSQSSACDPVFEHLFAQQQISDAQVWQRFNKAVNSGNAKLGQYLLDTHLAPKYHGQAKLWLKYRKDPIAAVEEAIRSPKLYSRSMMVKAMRRVADRDADKAQEFWPKLQKRYRFTDAEQAKVQAGMGLHAALQKRPYAEQILSQVSGKALTKSIREWRVRNAIQNYDWPRVSHWISKLRASEQDDWRWRYWRARANEEQGATAAATQEYQILAQDRGYYSWLSADRLGARYNIEHIPLTANNAVQQSILQRSNIRRALEMHAVKLPSFAKPAWNRGIKGLSRAELAQAALIAAEVDWPNQAIRTLSRARNNDDQSIRYPIAYSDHLTSRTDQLGIDPAWVYGLMRAESLFETTARSPVGARGLMQLMPGTGRKVAEELGQPLNNEEELYNPKLNMTLGTQYLADMLARFDGNMVLATAAYNAGPHRVEKWLPESGSIPADVWADTIPYKETRGYITKVMAFAAMFDWRLQNGTDNPNIQPARLSQRMQAITPDSSPK